MAQELCQIRKRQSSGRTAGRQWCVAACIFSAGATLWAQIPDDLSLASAPCVNSNYQAHNSITANTGFVPCAGSVISLSAGSQVTLGPTLNATAPQSTVTSFHAFIDPNLRLPPHLTVTTTALNGGQPFGVGGIVPTFRLLLTGNITATGGAGGYYVSGHTTLPPGISMGGTSGDQLSGTFTAGGSYSFNIIVADKNGLTGTGTMTIVVTSGSPSISPTVLPNGPVNTSYSKTITAAGGTPGYTWSLLSDPTGNFPGWLSLTPNGSSATLSGTTPSTGSFNFKVLVQDAAGKQTIATYTISVNPSPPSITTLSLPNGVVGAPYSAPALQATGGTMNFTWSANHASSGQCLSGQCLPDWLQLTSDGHLIGTAPSSPTTVHFQVTVSDGFTPAISKALTIVVVNQPPISITVTTSPPLLTVLVDGSPCISPCAYSWNPGDSHTLSIGNAQQALGGVTYTFNGWDRLTGSSPQVSPISATAYNASFSAPATPSITTKEYIRIGDRIVAIEVH